MVSGWNVDAHFCISLQECFLTKSEYLVRRQTTPTCRDMRSFYWRQEAAHSLKVSNLSGFCCLKQANLHLLTPQGINCNEKPVCHAVPSRSTIFTIVFIAASHMLPSIPTVITLYSCKDYSKQTLVGVNQKLNQQMHYESLLEFMNILCIYSTCMCITHTHAAIKHKPWQWVRSWQRTLENNLSPRQWQSERDGPMQLKEIGGGPVVETASFVLS